MKKRTIFFALFIGVLSLRTEVSFGQGTLLLSNFVPGAIDAPFFATDIGFGPGWTAQLFRAAGDPDMGTPGGDPIVPLLPTTTFQDSPRGMYLRDVLVTVPDTVPGQRIYVVGKITFDADPNGPYPVFDNGGLPVTLGGGNLPPGVLEGMQGFTWVPEPSTGHLVAVGIILSAFQLFKKRARRG